MGRSGTYDLIRKKDTSFRSFILVFLGVLIVLVAIYLIMAYGVRSNNKASGISEKLLRVSTTSQTTTDDTAKQENSDNLQQNIPTNDEITINEFATDDSKNILATSTSRTTNKSTAILTTSLDDQQQKTSLVHYLTTKTEGPIKLSTPSPETTKIGDTRISEEYFELQSTTDANEKLVAHKSISNIPYDSPTTTIESINSRDDDEQYTVPSILLQNLYSEETGGSDKSILTIPVTRNGDTYIQEKDYYKWQTTTETKELLKTSRSISKNTENISTTSPGTTIPVESMSSPSDQQQHRVSNILAEYFSRTAADATYIQVTDSYEVQTIAETNERVSTSRSISENTENITTSPGTTIPVESMSSPSDQQQHRVSNISAEYSSRTATDATYIQVTDSDGVQTIAETNERVSTSRSMSENTENITTNLGFTIPVESLRSPDQQQITDETNDKTVTSGSIPKSSENIPNTSPGITIPNESTHSPAHQTQNIVSTISVERLANIENASSNEPEEITSITYTPIQKEYSNDLQRSADETSERSISALEGSRIISTTTPDTTRTIESMNSRDDQEGNAAPNGPSKDLDTPSYEQITPGTTPAEDRTCRAPICKKTSAMWLTMMNYRGSANACEDFYDFACGEPNVFHMSDTYIQSTTKALRAQIEESKKNSKYSQIFSDFYKYCNTYRDEFLMKDALNSLISIEHESLTDIFIRLLLTQSMPFFDIGLMVADNQSLAYELTLPDLSSLRTSLPGWSLMERMKKRCIEESTIKSRGNEIFVDDLVESIHQCVKNDTKTYITNFIEEMKLIEDMSKLSNIKSLVNSFTNHAHDLQVLMDVLQDQLLVNFNSSVHTSKNEDENRKTISLKELNDQFKLQDLNWTQVFEGISRNVENMGEIRVDVYFPAYMTTVIGEFSKNQKISSILNLWYNIQLYRNTRFGANYEHRNTHCIELASQLMPEISVSHIHDISSNQRSPRSERYELVESLFQQLKERLRTSLKENVTTNSMKIFHDRLDEIQLSNSSVTKNILSSDAYVKDLDLNNKTYSYHQKLMVLLRNYRRNVYSLVGRNYSDNFAEILLSYFVDPFETKPHAFPPFRDIVFHPGFLYGISPKLPKYVELATKGFHLSKEIVKHFEKNDFNHELQGDEGTIYEKLKYGSETAESNLIGGVKYTFDNETYDINHNRCIGKCLNSNSIFEDNAAFRLVTDTLMEVLDNTTFLPFMDKTLPAVQKTFVTFIAHEFCKRHTLEDFISDYYGGMELPAPVKLRNMVRNSAFFNELYGCSPKRSFTYQFPYIPQFDSTPMYN